MSTITHPPADVSSPPQTASVSSRAGGRFRGLVGQGLPNLLVFALLAGVFLVGHQTGWKLPRLGEMFTTAPAADDWCADHLVPESICVECKEGLLPKPPKFGFCRAHGVAECVTCHPELAQVSGEPRLPAYDTAEAIALMSRPENNSRNTLHERRVQFASPAAAQKAGVDVGVVQERKMTDAVTANGEIQFDPTRVAHLAPRAAGTVTQVYKILGDEVAPGDVLALVDVAAVGQAKSDLLQAIVQRQLKRSSYERLKAAGIGVAGITLTEAKAALEEAEVAFISARQALVNLGLEVPEEFDETNARKISEDLRFLGIPSDVLATLPPENRSANLFAVRAPHPGVIVASDSVVGEVVDPQDVLFTVADPARMWLVLAVPQEDARYVKRDLPVEFRTEDGSTEATGRITWVGSGIDERTRTLPARVVLENASGQLKDKTFGTGRIVLREEPQAVVVPRAAVQTTPDAAFVFVRDRNYLKPGSPSVFHVRQVRTGAHDDQYVELLAGALPGEVIATQGSSVILSQLLRSNLGVACGCFDDKGK
jgi:cobalt-zinc-cadmium efflux system membrane fusion protein